MNNLHYKGFLGSMDINVEDGVIFGKLLYINDLVTFESESVSEIQKSFEDAVDDYIEFCKECGKEPEKTFNGVFNVRVSPERHKKAVYKATELGITLNQFVDMAIAEKLSDNINSREHAEISKKVDNLNTAVSCLNNNLAISNLNNQFFMLKGGK